MTKKSTANVSALMFFPHGTALTELCAKTKGETVFYKTKGAVQIDCVIRGRYAYGRLMLRVRHPGPDTDYSVNGYVASSSPVCISHTIEIKTKGEYEIDLIGDERTRIFRHKISVQ